MSFLDLQFILWHFKDSNLNKKWELDYLKNVNIEDTHSKFQVGRMVCKRATEK